MGIGPHCSSLDAVVRWGIHHHYGSRALFLARYVIPFLLNASQADRLRGDLGRSAFLALFGRNAVHRRETIPKEGKGGRLFGLARSKTGYDYPYNHYTGLLTGVLMLSKRAGRRCRIISTCCLPSKGPDFISLV